MIQVLLLIINRGVVLKLLLLVSFMYPYFINDYNYFYFTILLN
jgi:hypothetical protein